MQKESRYELIPSRNIDYQIIVQSDWLKACQAINEKSDLSQASSRAHCYASFLFFFITSLDFIFGKRPRALF